MCKIQFDSDVKAMKIKLNGSGWFPHGHNLLLVYYRFEYKGNFYKCGLYYTWVQILLQKGPFLPLVSWVKMLFQMRPLLRLGPVITLVPSTPVRLVRWKWKCRNDGALFLCAR